MEYPSAEDSTNFQRSPPTYTYMEVHIYDRVIAKIRYTWPLFDQSNLHTKNMYKSHARSPAIGQADIVPDDVGSKKVKVYLTLSTLSSFQRISADCEPIRRAIRTLFFLCVCVCGPSVGLHLYSYVRMYLYIPGTC